MRFKSGGGGHAASRSLVDASDYYSHEYDPDLVCLTVAKERYRLNDKDLQGLKVSLRENPHGVHFAPMKLYRKADVKVRGRLPTRVLCVARPIVARARSAVAMCNAATPRCYTLVARCVACCARVRGASLGASRRKL